jgi:WhiB family redox-sensing transcriptional regulator
VLLDGTFWSLRASEGIEVMKMDTDWMALGNCRDEPPSLFFPSDGVGVEIARKLCATCPVQAPCLEYALRNRIDHGVWGGASERERRRILRQRRQAAAAAAATANRR